MKKFCFRHCDTLIRKISKAHRLVSKLLTLLLQKSGKVAKAADDLPDGTSEILGIDIFLHRRCLFSSWLHQSLIQYIYGIIGCMQYVHRQLGPSGLSKIIVSRFRGCWIFYALCAILRDSDFRHGQALSPVGGGAEVMGAADELARKAVPITSAP